MCYFAEVWADFDHYEKLGGKLHIHEFAQLIWERKELGDWVRKVPKRTRDTLAKARREAEMPLAKVAEAGRAAVVKAEAELKAQTARSDKAVQILAGPKPKKKAENDLRISLDKIKRAQRDLDDLQRATILVRDTRIFPGTFASVLIELDGERQIVPMRYQCWLPGWNEAVERQYPGTYNARHDSLAKSWTKLFGYQHGLIVVEKICEHVDRDGKNVVLDDDHQLMYTACLWNLSPGQNGDPWSCAAITDEPPKEIALAGHDCCIIEIRPENIDVWLRPGVNDLGALYRIFDDKPRPFYEHREAA